MDHLMKHLDQLGAGNNYDMWNQFPLTEIFGGDRNAGYGIRERFTNFGSIDPGIAGDTAFKAHQGYSAYVDTTTAAGSIKQLTAAGGGIRITAGTTANHETWLQAGGTSGAPFVISDAAPKTLVFEWAIRFASIANSKAAWFTGLGEEGLAAADTMADTTGVLASKDYVGFVRNLADGDALDFVYRLAGQTAVVKAADILTLEADTWYRIGFKFQTAPGAIRVVPWVNDIRDAANSITAAEIAVATGEAFPDAQPMSPLFGGKAVAAEAHTMDIRWFDIAQVA